MSKTVFVGVIATILAYFMFSLQDASVKWLVVAIPVVQILFVRSVTILLICLAIGRGEVVVQAVQGSTRLAAGEAWKIPPLSGALVIAE